MTFLWKHLHFAIWFKPLLSIRRCMAQKLFTHGAIISSSQDLFRVRMHLYLCEDAWKIMSRRMFPPISAFFRTCVALYSSLPSTCTIQNSWNSFLQMWWKRWVSVSRSSPSWLLCRTFVIGFHPYNDTVDCHAAERSRLESWRRFCILVCFHG